MTEEEIKALVASSMTDALKTFQTEFGATIGKHVKTAAETAQAETLSKIQALEAQLAANATKTPTAPGTEVALKKTELSEAQMVIDRLNKQINDMKGIQERTIADSKTRAHKDAVLRNLVQHGVDSKMSSIVLPTLMGMSKEDPSNPGEYIMEIPGSNDHFGVPETFRLDKGIATWVQSDTGSRFVDPKRTGAGPATTPPSHMQHNPAASTNFGEFAAGGANPLHMAVGNMLRNN